MGIFMSESNFFESSRVSARRPECAFKPFGFSYLSGPEVPFVQFHQHDELEVGCPHDGEMGVFRRVSGMTLLEYIARQRVAYAQRLLATTSLKIIDVAMDSGFGSVCRFHAVFARLCGTTPRQYRARLRGNGAPSNA